ncbi:esterase/lipase family protein [Thioalkalivibrio sp.]|uniref:esterase/lipase family protein n=1 Tax=Thioalkalivibrio sp. TaxID=2093813 RepID=UPI003563A5AD
MLRATLFLLLLGLLPQAALAQVMLLIPGVQSQQQTHPFREAGVTVPLVASGWIDGGQMLPSVRGVEFDRSPEARSRLFYTLVMPTERPISMQAEWLNLYLDAVTRRHPDEPVILVAHSLAGIVARYSLVTRKRPEVSALITIASPHVDGTMIQLGDFFWQSPLGTYTPLLGQSDLRQLLELYSGISPDQSGNVLRWLSHQTHPDIRYVGIVRMADTVVEPMLQDLNRVSDLRGRAERLLSPGGHALAGSDGTILAALFSQSVGESER